MGLNAPARGESGLGLNSDESGYDWVWACVGPIAREPGGVNLNERAPVRRRT